MICVEYKAYVSIWRISPSSVGLKSPPGSGGNSANAGRKKKTNEDDAVSEPPNTWVRAIRYAIGGQGVRGREPAASSECLYPHLPAITAVFGACCTMAKVWLPIAHLAALVASDIQMVNGKW